MATTFDKVKEIIKPIVNEDTLSEATTLRSLHLDALDLVSLVNDLEEEFGIVIEDEAAEKLRTVAEIVKLVDKKLATKEGA